MRRQGLPPGGKCGLSLNRTKYVGVFYTRPPGGHAVKHNDSICGELNARQLGPHDVRMGTQRERHKFLGKKKITESFALQTFKQLV